MRVQIALTLPSTRSQQQTQAADPLVLIAGGGANTPTKTCSRPAALNSPAMVNKRGAQQLRSAVSMIFQMWRTRPWREISRGLGVPVVPLEN